MKFVSTAALAAVLTGCAADAIKPLHPGAVPASSRPTQLVQFTGSTAPDLSVPELIAVYATAFPLSSRPPRKCVAWNNPLEGVSGPKIIEAHIPTVRQGSEVSAKLYLDRYIPGDCNWRLREVDAEVVDDAGMHFRQRIGYGLEYARIAAQTSPIKPDNLVTFYCVTGLPYFACGPKMYGPPSTDGVEVMLGPTTKLVRFDARRGPR